MRSHAAHGRRFGYALAVSIAVHVIVLSSGLPAPRESLQEPVALPPLVTRVVELPKPAGAAPAPPEEKKPPAPRRELRKAQAPKPSLEAPPVAEAAREPAPPATAPLSTPAPQPRVDNRAAAAMTAAQYRMQIIAYAQRNKPPYPRLARESNWAGEVTLEITLRADGQAELGLRRGSGYEVLDKLALDTYQQALRVVPVPTALQGRQVRLEPLRVIYNLTE